MSGSQLLEELINATGLPKELVSKELSALLAAHQISENDLTMDRLREILAGYLQEQLLNAKEYYR